MIMKHLKLFFALFAMLALGVGNAWGETVTYQHVFNKKPSTGNSVALSSVNWKIEATALNNYNSNNYAGVQIGSSKAAGSITLTSTTDWDYNGNGKITEVRLWLNTGGSTVTPTVTIGGKSATSDGTQVVKNSKAGTDWTKATKVTFTPVADGNTGVVVINVSTEKAGYICAMEIDCEPATADGDDEGGNVEIVESPTFSETEVNFTEAFDLTIASAEGTTLKYTLDNSDPTTSNTAVVVESNIATVAVSGKSTVVKAVAVKGELVSGVKSITYCYVNSKETAYTITEALEVYNAGLGLDNSLYIQGTVKSITEMNTTQYYNANYTITDGENDLYIFRGKGIDGANFTSESQLLVGDDLVIYGKLSEYQGIPQVAQDSKIISRESKTKAIIAEDLTFDAIAIGAEVEAQTLTVTGANLTAEIAATLDNENFTVTPATLSVDGGELTITPATDLAVGEHTATLTLTSGETTKEVALSILVKNVYTITWSVNGEISTTSVVEGDKLVLPTAPETPEACSEKVFVGWTAAEEVNADGSDIEWVTAATAPTAAATYYAVFAVQEGEGGLSEVVDVLDRALTGVEGTNYASWADVSATSDAVYAGQSAGGNEAIQLRSNNSNSGVISTTSGGKLAKVTVKWNSNTASGRTLSVYGSNTAYTSPTELYGETSGEKLGTIVNGTSTELVIDGNYAYVGLRSNSGAMYLDEIQITWLAGAAATYTNYSTTCVAPVVNHTITATAGEGGTVTGLENDGVYAEGTELTLTATPADHYVFVNWTKGEEVVAETAEYTFTVEADVELKANFARDTHTVNATAENGTVTGSGEYTHGAEVTLTATPAFDYQFVNWSNGSTENPLTITVEDNIELEAVFAEVAATEKKESGVFSISAHKTATFATGNLQHNVGTGEWRFAKQQYQVVGEQNINLGDPAFSGWIDMLGWSTNDEGNNFGVNPSNVNELYAGEFVDWGTKMGAEWSTLSADDWKYLLNTRANAADLKQVAKVGTMVGILLFPDVWTMPEGCTVEAEKDEYFNVNIYNYTIAQWNEMEAAGAVFLPAAGRRTGGYGNKINYDQVEETDENNLNGGYYRHQDNTNIYCYYWTSTINAETKNVSYLHNIVALGNDEYTIGTGAIWGEKGRYGQSVRLAKVAYDTHTVKVTAENGTVEGAGTYEHGATATLTAAPAEHYVFVNWTKGEEVVAETAEYTFTVEADVELVANFKLDNHTVTATAENGTVTGADTYEHGTEVTLTATAAEGYEFVNWTVGEETIAENPYKFTVTADVALVANFEKVVPATETVYFINTKKWSAVKAHAWGGKATGTNWPGLATIKETEKIANNDVYSFTANVGDYANIIFNNNNQGSQTPDLVWTAGKYYVIDMGWLTKEEAEAKLAAPLPEVWNVVGEAGLMGKGWDLNAAENAMTKQADGTYKLVKTDITITAGIYEYKAAKDHDWAVAVPQSGNQKLTISTSGVYDVTFVLNVTTKKLTATATLKQAAVVIPSVIIAGSMNSWSQEQDKFTMSPDSLTATFKTTLEVKDYEFKMIVGGAWHSDAKTITRANNSTKFTGANSNTNTTLKADVAGEYLFTWEYATKTLTVTYPALPVKYNVTVTAENGTVTGAGEYEEGATATLTATAAEGYEFVNWTVGEEVVSTENPYSFVVTADVALVANFTPTLPTEIKISGEATHTEYNFGEQFDVTGLVVTAVYSDKEVDITEQVEWTMSPLTIGTTAVEVKATYGTFSATKTCNVTVHVPHNKVTTADVLDGIFLVSDTKAVKFSTGNLQYNCGTYTWSFAEEQYEIIGGEAYDGTNNTNYGMNLPGYTGKLDLFAWSCESSKYGVNPSNTDADYTGAFVDWGTLVEETGWYTLTQAEMQYLLNQKKDGKALWTFASIEGIKGLMLMPYNWDVKLNDDIEYGYAPKDFSAEFEHNVFTADEWNGFQGSGAAFLPTAGSRTGGYGNTENAGVSNKYDENGHYFHVDNVNDYGYYWLNTEDSRDGYQHCASYLIFPGWSDNELKDDESDDFNYGPTIWSREKRRGNSVRLVKETTRPEDAPTDIFNLETGIAPQKIFMNGQLIIIKNGVTYNAQGQVVK